MYPQLDKSLVGKMIDFSSEMYQEICVKGSFGRYFLEDLCIEYLEMGLLGNSTSEIFLGGATALPNRCYVKILKTLKYGMQLSL